MYRLSCLLGLHAGQEEPAPCQHGMSCGDDSRDAMQGEGVPDGTGGATRPLTLEGGRCNSQLLCLRRWRRTP